MPHEVRPRTGELQQAHAVVGTALDACERELPREDREALTASLAWTADPFVRERLAGVDGACPGPAEIRLAFNADTPEWADALPAQVARCYGQAHVVGGFDGGVVFAWQHLLAEAAGAALVARLYPDAPTPWREPDADPASRSDAGDAWRDVRGRLDERVDPDAPPGGAHDPAMPAALGAAVHEGMDRDLSAYPEATRSAVRAAGDRVLTE